MLVLAGPVQLERVDLLAEDPGTWINYELPAAPGYMTTPAIRFVEQVKLVWATPMAGVTVGTSLISQSVAYQRPLPVAGLAWSAGVQTSMGLPRGVFGGVSWRAGRVRVAAGASAVSSASWARREWSTWEVLPTVGVGIVVGRKSED
jgi:hypothetical protein